jgi:hypothetical protein
MGPFKALGALFTALFVFFGALEKGAKALDHIATIGEESAEAMMLKNRAERQAEVAETREANKALLAKYAKQQAA